MAEKKYVAYVGTYTHGESKGRPWIQANSQLV